MALPRIAWRWTLVRHGIRLLRRLAGIRLKVAGRDHIPPRTRAFVLAANHQSYVDALALIEATARPLSFVAKKELANRPMIGRFLARLGTLFVDRFDLRRGAAASERTLAVLDRGGILAFFPEGTFRDASGLLPFRMGAFVAAARRGVPVLPVALRGTREIMTGDSFFPRKGRCEVHIGPILWPEGSDWASAVVLRDRARAYVLARCGEPNCAREGIRNGIRDP
jgi:1-acyl-sn-glycerol-3-phosphate acyltransferase